MVKRRLLLTFCFGAWIACADGMGPPGDPGEPPRTPERAQLHELRWKPTEQPRVFEAKGNVDLANIVQSASAGGQVTSYTLSFWALYGEERTVEIEFSDDYGGNQSLLQFEVPRHALRAHPDGTPFSDGDSVFISVTFDTDQFLAQFEPSGLQFDPATPAVLRFWYTGADEDFNGDGKVDSDDNFLESELLDLWYQDDSTSGWSRLSTIHDIEKKQYRLNLEHFSSYAVSY